MDSEAVLLQQQVTDWPSHCKRGILTIHLPHCGAAGAIGESHLVIIEGDAFIGKPDDDIIALVFFGVLLVHHGAALLHLARRGR